MLTYPLPFSDATDHCSACFFLGINSFSFHKWVRTSLTLRTWLLPFNELSALFTHVATNDSILFFNGWKLLFCVHTTFSLAIHLPVDTLIDSVSWPLWTGCSRYGLQASLWYDCSIFFGYKPNNGLAESHYSSVFSFLRKYHSVLHSDCTILHSQWQYIGVHLFSMSSQPFLLSGGHSNWNEIISHHSFKSLS